MFLSRLFEKKKTIGGNIRFYSNIMKNKKIFINISVFKVLSQIIKKFKLKMRAEINIYFY